MTRRIAPKDERALLVSGVWLYVGLVGATAVAAALLQLLDEGGWLSALALAVSGCVLAAASWSRARSVLDAGRTAGAEAPGKPGSRASRQSGLAAITLLPAVRRRAAPQPRAGE
jgi:hypothetical protein